MTERRSFSGEPASVEHARRYVAQQLAHYPSNLVEDAVLMVSELATNSVRHAGTGFTVEVRRERSEICVEVADTGAGMPRLGSPAVDAISGRGLRIVDALANRWGEAAAPSGPGKGVWFSLSFATDLSY